MKKVKEKIKEVYADIAEATPGASSCCRAGAVAASPSCCGSSAELTGFKEEYSTLPGYEAEADLGLGCGIPVEFAGIEKGQTVLDLGSGAGNDVFVARSLVGEEGKVTGVDMTPAMIEKANKNKGKLGYNNVEFILGDIEELPVPDLSIDTAISNCVLNLVSDKLVAYREIYRVLRNPGHFSISDVVVSGPLTDKMKNVVELYAGCIAGAMEKSEYLQTIRKAGFKNVEVKKEKVVYLPDSFLSQYLTEKELIEFRSTGVQVLSITVSGYKN